MHCLGNPQQFIQRVLATCATVALSAWVFLYAVKSISGCENGGDPYLKASNKVGQLCSSFGGKTPTGLSFLGAVEEVTGAGGGWGAADEFMEGSGKQSLTSAVNKDPTAYFSKRG